MRLGFLLLLLLLPGCMGRAAHLQAYFCNNSLCNQVFFNLISNAQTRVDCAFYSLDSVMLVNALNKAHSRVVVYQNPPNRSYVRPVKSRGIMHNKFCVIDEETVVTGSYNPSDREKGELNSIVVVKSKYVASLYEAEFCELWRGVFGKGQPSSLQFQNLRAYFCPEDDCAARVSMELSKAKHEIRFMYYTFTSGEIALAMINAMHRGVKVSGVVEGSQLSQYSQYKLLKAQGIGIKAENTSQLLHHKFVVIDNTTLIIGSYNPTKNAQLRNDENIIIIRDRALATKFAHLGV